MIREVAVSTIIPLVREMCVEANRFIPPAVQERMINALSSETDPLARDILNTCIRNNELAAAESMPICQDTGVAVMFVEVGQDVHITGGNLREALNEGVRQGYRDGYLRKSMVDDPVIARKNTGDNTPAMIHFDIVPGDRIRITFAPKGGGAENMSALRMMTPAEGLPGVIDFVLDTVRHAGGNPCPPVIVGIGLGGNFEQCAILAKKAVLEPIDRIHPEWAAVEADLLSRINALGIGPQGLGGRNTALAVRILSLPCHIASMPVAINLQCHAARHSFIEI